jgi:predicted DNA-binding protein
MRLLTYWSNLMLRIQLSPELHRRARIKSAETGRPIADVVREALRKWVDSDSAQAG